MNELIPLREITLFEMPSAQDGEFQRSAEKGMTKVERGRVYARYAQTLPARFLWTDWF